MTTGIDRTNGHAAAAELALISGDLGKLTPEARLDYYQRVCQSTGLNPWTQPFSYIVLNNKLTLYCRKDATDQLRKIHQVSVTITSRERIDDVYVVTARATLPDGRTDESIGAVTLGSLKGDGLANALMKAESKAKRRVTLSICGLGMLDESETSTIPDAQTVQVDQNTGEIIGAARRITNPPPPRVLTKDPERERKALFHRLDTFVERAKAAGIKVQDAEQLLMDGTASNEEIIDMGKSLRDAIEHYEAKMRAGLAEMDEDDGGEFEEVSNAELFPNGAPA